MKVVSISGDGADKETLRGRAMNAIRSTLNNLIEEHEDSHFVVIGILTSLSIEYHEALHEYDEDLEL